jgi:hypothetical protein
MPSNCAKSRVYARPPQPIFSALRFPSIFGTPYMEVQMERFEDKLWSLLKAPTGPLAS